MKVIKAVVVLLAAGLVAAPVVTMAQTSQAASAAAKAATHVVTAPTGPMTALTKAANLVRASRAAAIKATGNASLAAASNGLSRATSIVGYLWTSNDGVIGNATVQLRNTVTGAVVDQVKSNALGEFVFNNVDSGEYAVEYVSNAATTAGTTAANSAASNVVQAVGQPFTAAPGETVATFVRLANAPAIIVPDLASNIATSAVQTAASAGVTTVVTPIAPVTEAPPPAGPPPVGEAPPVVSTPPSVASSIK
jgi:hypothetical protein